jgi:hypothetical protein
MDKRLIKLARISPPGFADLIMRRNRSLLEHLMLLKPYIGKGVMDIPDSVTKKAIKETHFGCPHCDGCDQCLWSEVCEASYTDTGACLSVPFKLGRHNLCLSDVRYAMPLSVNYWSKSEELMLEGDGILTERNFYSCKAFLDAHIKWASLECWGKDYKLKVPEKLDM